MDRTNNGVFQQGKCRTRLSPLDSYHGPYLHEIESMKSARDFLVSWCSRSQKPVWNKIYVSHTVHTGSKNDGYGVASSKFSYADFPNGHIDVPIVDVPCDILVKNEDNFSCAPTSGLKTVKVETEVPHECPPVKPGHAPTIKRESHSSMQVGSPSYQRPYSPNLNKNVSKARQDNRQRLNSSGTGHSTYMDELNANISPIGHNSLGAGNAEATYLNSPKRVQFKSHVKETKYYYSTHFNVTSTDGVRKKRSYYSAFESTQWHTNLNEAYSNDSHFSHVETESSGYCKENRIDNSAFNNFSDSQTNLNNAYGHNNNVSYVETPFRVPYNHYRRFYNYV